MNQEDIKAAAEAFIAARPELATVPLDIALRRAFVEGVGYGIDGLLSAVTGAEAVAKAMRK